MKTISKECKAQYISPKLRLRYPAFESQFLNSVTVRDTDNEGWEFTDVDW